MTGEHAAGRDGHGDRDLVRGLQHVPLARCRVVDDGDGGVDLERRGPPMDESENSERVRPSLSRHSRMVFCRTMRLPSGSVVTVWLVPSAEYGAPVTSRTLLGDGLRRGAPADGDGGQSGIAAASCGACAGACRPSSAAAARARY